MINLVGWMLLLLVRRSRVNVSGWPISNAWTLICGDNLFTMAWASLLFAPLALSILSKVSPLLTLMSRVTGLNDGSASAAVDEFRVKVCDWPFGSFEAGPSEANCVADNDLRAMLDCACCESFGMSFSDTFFALRGAASGLFFEVKGGFVTNAILEFFGLFIGFMTIVEFRFVLRLTCCCCGMPTLVVVKSEVFVLFIGVVIDVGIVGLLVMLKEAGWLMNMVDILFILVERPQNAPAKNNRLIAPVVIDDHIHLELMSIFSL